MSEKHLIEYRDGFFDILIFRKEKEMKKISKFLFEEKVIEVFKGKGEPTKEHTKQALTGKCSDACGDANTNFWQMKRIYKEIH